MSLERTYVWRKLRERKILRQHARVAAICEDLIARYRAGGPVVEQKAKKHRTILDQVNGLFMHF